MDMRLLAIGDIHGYLGSLEALLSEVNPTPQDRVVFLGDYVNKGPSVSSTLDFLVELSRHPDWIFLRGNHDQMMLDTYHDLDSLDAWECLSGGNPLASYGRGSTVDLLTRVPRSHWKFLEERCRDFFETESHIFLHGGIRPSLEPCQEEVERLHSMVLSDAMPHESGRLVVCGHSSQATGEIADLGHTICIDTGIAKGQFLTCLDLADFSYTQASEKGEIRKGQLRPIGSSALVEGRKGVESESIG